ncbi:endonuclease V [Thalassobius sp. MITS945101]|uniref:endonuclease V n=1 Tax=Thalassobius sp. MITS945101 TaxID=3096994 RepID=UPI00399B41E6
MILATDVHYDGDQAAIAAGVLFADWQDASAQSRLTTAISPIAPYQSGAFYQRELPCLIALINGLDKQPETIVIDGFVTLGTEQQPGLGAHLFAALEARIPVIGVAKTAYRNTPANCAVHRGQSAQPLFVTAAGVDLDTAKAHIRAMHGAYRIPTLLREVDQLARTELARQQA